MNTGICIRCDKNFRKHSMKSRDRICWDCREQKNYKQIAMVEEVPNNVLEARLDAVEKSLQTLHTVIGVEINTSIRLEVETLIQGIFDEKLSELKGLIASTLTKSKKTQEEVKKLNAKVKARMGTLAKAWKAIERLREEIEDIHNE